MLGVALSHNQAIDFRKRTELQYLFHASLLPYYPSLSFTFLFGRMKIL